MSNLYIFYWTAGSAGDMVQHLLINSRDFIGLPGAFELTNSGRYAPIVNLALQDQLSIKPSYTHEWQPDELDKLIEFSQSQNLNFIIGTHRLDQIDQVKQLVPSAISMGITYSSDLFYLVLKNWCQKESTTSETVRAVYEQSHPVLFKQLRERGIVAPFILKEHLRHGSTLLESVSHQFDININLGDLYAGDLSGLKKEFNNLDLNLFDRWYDKQDPLFRFQRQRNIHVDAMLGFNSRAAISSPSPLMLTHLDQILVKHYCRKHQIPAPDVENVEELLNYFNQLDLS